MHRNQILKYKDYTHKLLGFSCTHLFFHSKSVFYNFKGNF